MKFLFVWPNKDQYGYKPIGISLLSALLKTDGHKVELFDTTFINLGFKTNKEVKERISVFKSVDDSGYDLDKTKNLEEEISNKLKIFNPDIVGVSALSDERYISLQISKLIKEYNKNIIIIFGNKLATMNPSFLLKSKYVDYICRGEGIVFIREFVNKIENNSDIKDINNIGYKIKKEHRLNKLDSLYQDLDALPYLDWDIFDKRQFLKPYDGKLETGGDHMISYGCPNNCTYCINSSYKKLYPKERYLRFYSIDRILDELEYLTKRYKITFFKYHDEDFCLKSDVYMKELSKKYADRINIPFSIMVNAKRATRYKINLLKDMNCASVSIGIETGNSHLRKIILNRYETEEDIINCSNYFNEVGIRTSSFNMLAIPFETRETIMETIELNRKAEVKVPNTTFFFPLDGTELKQIAIDNKFYEEDTKRVYEQEKPSLKLNTISTKELIALRERFLLYVKLPKEYYPLIRESEKETKCGKMITKELFTIYKNYYEN